MDDRSPHAFARDRSLIHNPNHQSAPPPPPPPPPQHPPFSSFASAGSQAPSVHVPFSDPYHRSDPFLPTPQHQRRSSQSDRPSLGGSWPSAGSQHSLQHGHHSSQSSLPPPPPPQLPTTLPPTSSAPFPEPTRRSSLGGGSPSGYYQTTRDPLPPPPTIGNRPMPPPSPQQSNSASTLANQRLFSGTRELPGLGSSHRPGSGMSISSILGGEMPSTAPSQNSPPTATMTASPSGKGMQPPSPMRAPSAGARPEYGLYRRPLTPDKFSAGSGSRSAEAQAYAPVSPSKPPGSAGSSSDQHRQGLSQGPPAPSWKSMGVQDSRFYSATSASRDKEPISQSASGMPPRPNSQPTGPAALGVDAERKQGLDTIGFRRTPYPSTYSPEGRRTISEHGQPRSAVQDVNDRPSQASADQARPVTVQPVSHSAFSPPREPPISSQSHSVHAQSQPQGLFWRHQVSDENRRQVGPQGRDDAAAGRPPFSLQATSGPSPRPGSLSTDGTPLPPRPLDYNNPRSTGHYQPPPTSDPSSSSSLDRRRELAAGQHGRASPYDQHSQRSFLDANRRTGRASPLPQAVQGASLQPVGPAGNPNIKSEFGRMFSGLGGGISSVPSRNGTLTPSRQSPLPHGTGESFAPGSGGHHDLDMVRTGSQSGRRNKRTKDEDGMVDSDSLDGRVTPSLAAAAARGAKRSKHAHQGHHHHHHTHHHHHHHHKPEEEIPGPPAASVTTAAAAAAVAVTAPPAAPVQPMNGTRLNANTPQGNMSAQAAHHHHHHHTTHPPHHHHHHHHPARPGTVPPAPAPAPPRVIVNIQPVLEQVAQLPRHHLGSQLYEAQAVLPPSTVSLDDKFMVSSYPKPLPPFTQDRANCTFTIRVPRYYLRERQRELLCKRPYIWGARIYRDDSDPLAAAIHSGWIRGAWDKEEVDVSMLDPRLQGSPAETPDPDEPVTTQPTTPVEPPKEYDVHLTLLILPPLEKYHSTSEYGIKSRKAGGGYHGMSFTILSMRWVDEGVGSRGQERGAEARNKRLSAAAALMKLMAGGMERPVEQGVVRKAAVGA